MPKSEFLRQSFLYLNLKKNYSLIFAGVENLLNLPLLSLILTEK